jgi:hypothetical protein
LKRQSKHQNQTRYDTIDWAWLRNVSELENISIELFQLMYKMKRKSKKIEQNIQKLWGHFRRCSTYIVITQEGEQRIVKQVLTEECLSIFQN